MNNDIKIGKIFQTIGQSAKYHIYQTSSIEALEDKRLIGVANTYKEACKTIHEHLAENDFHQDPYWRFVMNETATFIDYGSWSKFMAIVPPVPMKEIMGEEE